MAIFTFLYSRKTGKYDNLAELRNVCIGAVVVGRMYTSAKLRKMTLMVGCQL
jgi:hypothetical protein